MRIVVAVFAIASMFATVEGLPTPAWAGSAGALEGGNSVSVGVSSSSNSSSDRSPNHSGNQGPSGSARQSTEKSQPECQLVPLSTVSSVSIPPGGLTPGQWYVLSCGGVPYIPSTGVFWIAAASGPPTSTGQPDPLELAEKAADSITLPAPSIDMNPTRYSVVNLPTWLWIDPSAWHPMTASASAGGVTATAVATPSTVTWSMGDGGTEVCDGPGIPYDQEQPASQQQTYCSYTYRRSSFGQPSADGDPNDGAYTVTATIGWAVTWTAIGAPGGGNLPALRTASTARVRVEQIESIDSAT